MPYGALYDTYSLKIIGNTLVRYCTEEQKNRFLPKIFSGDEHRCKGYSEPDAGSDLAALRTRATLDSGEWGIDGQKTWTSHAFDAQWCFVLARTTPGAVGHSGISFLLIRRRTWSKRWAVGGEWL